MLYKVYSIRDNKTASFARPFYDLSDVQATRALQVAVNDDTIQISHFAADFDLMFLGTFDDETGKHDCVLPKFICSAVSLKKMQADEQKKEALSNG